MNLKFIVISAFSILLSGCFAPPLQPTPPPPPKIDLNNPIEIKNKVSIKNDNFEKTVTYQGPDIDIDISETEVQTINLRSKTSLKTGNKLFQIYTSNIYEGSWRFYDKAYSSEGDKLEITLISKNVDCYKHRCLYIEVIGVNITRDYLEKHSETGIKYKVSGKYGSSIFFVPAAYIKGFLSAVPNN